MKVKELIEQLSKFDQNRDIFIGYDYPYDVQEPQFVPFDPEECFYFPRDEKRLKEGDYIHYAE